MSPAIVSNHATSYWHACRVFPDWDYQAHGARCTQVGLDYPGHMDPDDALAEFSLVCEPPPPSWLAGETSRIVVLDDQGRLYEPGVGVIAYHDELLEEPAIVAA